MICRFSYRSVTTGCQQIHTHINSLSQPCEYVSCNWMAKSFIMISKLGKTGFTFWIHKGKTVTDQNQCDQKNVFDMGMGLLTE